MLVSSAFHPVTGGDNFYGVSGDYPWFFKQKIEELFGCPACFMLGAAGDAVPMLRGPGDGQKWARPVSSRRLLGETLAMTLRLNERKFRRDSRQDISMKVVDVPVSLSPELDYENAEKNYQEAEKNQAPDLAFRIESRYLAKTYPGMNFTMPLRFLRLSWSLPDGKGSPLQEDGLIARVRTLFPEIPEGGGIRTQSLKPELGHQDRRRRIVRQMPV